MTNEPADAQMPDRRALAIALISQVIERCGELTGPNPWWQQRLATIDRYLAGEADWTELDKAMREIYLDYLVRPARPPSRSVKAIAQAVDAIERLGKLIVHTDDAYLGTVLRDAAQCLGWHDVATTLAGALTEPTAVDVLVALLPHAETPATAIEAAQLLPDRQPNPHSAPK